MSSIDQLQHTPAAVPAQTPSEGQYSRNQALYPPSTEGCVASFIADTNSSTQWVYNENIPPSQGCAITVLQTTHNEGPQWPGFTSGKDPRIGT